MSGMDRGRQVIVQCGLDRELFEELEKWRAERLYPIQRAPAIRMLLQRGLQAFGEEVEMSMGRPVEVVLIGNEGGEP